jgi:hypothetical protein
MRAPATEQTTAMVMVSPAVVAAVGLAVGEVAAAGRVREDVVVDVSLVVSVASVVVVSVEVSVVVVSAGPSCSTLKERKVKLKVKRDGEEKLLTYTNWSTTANRPPGATLMMRTCSVLAKPFSCQRTLDSTVVAPSTTAGTVLSWRSITTGRPPSNVTWVVISSANRGALYEIPVPVKAIVSSPPITKEE